MQFHDNNWVRRLLGIKRADKRRIEELTVEVGAKECFKNKLVTSKLKCHVERMGDVKLAECRCPEREEKRRR